MTMLFAGSPILAAIANHVWQSTLVAAGAGALAWLVARGHARLRYRIWLIASLKFLLPFAALAALGRQFPWPQDPVAIPSATTVAAVQAVGEPFSLNDVQAHSPSIAAAQQAGSGTLLVLMVIVWAAGVVWTGWARGRRFTEIARAARRGELVDAGRVHEAWQRLDASSVPPIRVITSAPPLEPCIFGIARPVLLWPAGIDDRLSDAQLEAVLAHERCHIRAHHNLAAAGHLLVETLFWFHPIVWVVGTRLIAERERVCDEDVVRRGSQPDAYAESILKVCEFCVESRLACLAGVTGARLVARIEAIMTDHTPVQLGWPRRWLLGATAALLFVGPVVFGSVAASTPAVPAARALTPFVAATPAGSADAHVIEPAPIIGAASAPARNVEPVRRGGETNFITQATARISGVVKDQLGGLVPGVVVSAISTDGGTSGRSASGGSGAASGPGHTVTFGSGQYTLTDLTPGAYDVEFVMPGFRRLVKPVVLRAGESVIADAELTLGAVSESINLIGSPPADSVTSPRATSAVAIGSGVATEAHWLDEIARDPQNHLNYFELAAWYYRQERFTESETMIGRGVEVLDRQAATVPGRAFPPAPPAQWVGGNIRAPRKLRDVKPIYPAVPLAAGIEGIIVVDATISETGAVKGAKILRGVPGLDQAALGAIRQWLFVPTLLDGSPTPVAMTATITFALRGK